MAKFCCSIETEPRTLNQGQLHQAREVAIDIVQNKEADEASSMFFDGMKPGFTTKEMTMAISEANAILLNKVDENNEKTRTIETSCQCSCPSTAAIMDSPDQSGVKEPLSSPF